MKTRIIILLCLINQVLQSNGLVQLKNSLATSDSPLLMKILQSVDAATSDEHLLDVTLKLLKSLCVCMRETLKSKEEKFNTDNNLIEPNDSSSTDGKVLELYRKIYNNTCFNLRQELTNRTHKSISDEETTILNHTNCGKDEKNKTDAKVGAVDKAVTVKTIVPSRLEHVLFKALIQTKDLHKYRLKRYNLFGKGKPQTKTALRHSIIVILTLHPKSKEISSRSFSVAERELNKTLHTKSPIEIDIIDTKYDKKHQDKQKKLDNFTDCHLQSLYKFLADSEKKNRTKVFKFIRKRDTIKIYIEVNIRQNHTDYINACCVNGTLLQECSVDLINDIYESNNMTKQKTSHRSYRNTITKIKDLVKLYENKMNGTSENCNNITNNLTSISHGPGNRNTKATIFNIESTTNYIGTNPDQEYHKQNEIHKVLNSDSSQLSEVTKAIILLNDFVSKQTTKYDLNTNPTDKTDHTDKPWTNLLLEKEDSLQQEVTIKTSPINFPATFNVKQEIMYENKSTILTTFNGTDIVSITEKIPHRAVDYKQNNKITNETLGVTLPITDATTILKLASDLKPDMENFVNNSFESTTDNTLSSELTTGGAMENTFTENRITMKPTLEDIIKLTRTTLSLPNSYKENMVYATMSPSKDVISDQQKYYIITDRRSTMVTPALTLVPSTVKTDSFSVHTDNKTTQYAIQDTTEKLKFKISNQLKTVTTLKSTSYKIENKEFNQLSSSISTVNPIIYNRTKTKDTHQIDSLTEYYKNNTFSTEMTASKVSKLYEHINEIDLNPSLGLPELDNSVVQEKTSIDITTSNPGTPKAINIPALTINNSQKNTSSTTHSTNDIINKSRETSSSYSTQLFPLHNLPDNEDIKYINDKTKIQTTSTPLLTVATVVPKVSLQKIETEQVKNDIKEKVLNTTKLNPTTADVIHASGSNEINSDMLHDLIDKTQIELNDVITDHKIYETITITSPLMAITEESFIIKDSTLFKYVTDNQITIKRTPEPQITTTVKEKEPEMSLTTPFIVENITSTELAENTPTSASIYKINSKTVKTKPNEPKNVIAFETENHTKSFIAIEKSTKPYNGTIHLIKAIETSTIQPQKTNSYLFPKTRESDTIEKIKNFTLAFKSKSFDFTTEINHIDNSHWMANYLQKPTVKHITDISTTRNSPTISTKPIGLSPVKISIDNNKDNIENTSPFKDVTMYRQYQLTSEKPTNIKLMSQIPLMKLKTDLKPVFTEVPVSEATSQIMYPFKTNNIKKIVIPEGISNNYLNNEVTKEENEEKAENIPSTTVVPLQINSSLLTSLKGKFTSADSYTQIETPSLVTEKSTKHNKVTIKSISIEPWSKTTKKSHDLKHPSKNLKNNPKQINVTQESTDTTFKPLILANYFTSKLNETTEAVTIPEEIAIHKKYRDESITILNVTEKTTTIKSLTNDNWKVHIKPKSVNKLKTNIFANLPTTRNLTDMYMASKINSTKKKYISVNNTIDNVESPIRPLLKNDVTSTANLVVDDLQHTTINMNTENKLHGDIEDTLMSDSTTALNTFINEPAITKMYITTYLPSPATQTNHSNKVITILSEPEFTEMYKNSIHTEKSLISTQIIDKPDVSLSTQTGLIKNTTNVNIILEKPNMEMVTEKLTNVETTSDGLNIKELLTLGVNPIKSLDKPKLKLTTDYDITVTFQTPVEQNNLTFSDLTLLANKALIKFSSDYPFLPSRGNKTLKAKSAQINGSTLLSQKRKIVLEKPNLEMATTKSYNAKTSQAPNGQNNKKLPKLSTNQTLPDLTLLANKAMIKFSSDYPFVSLKGNKTLKAKSVQIEYQVTKNPVLSNITIEYYINPSSINNTTSPVVKLNLTDSAVTKLFISKFTEKTTESVQIKGSTAAIQKTKKPLEKPKMAVAPVAITPTLDGQNNVTLPDLTLLANKALVKFSSDYPFLPSRVNITTQTKLKVTTKPILYDIENKRFNATNISSVNITTSLVETDTNEKNITDSHDVKFIVNKEDDSHNKSLVYEQNITHESEKTEQLSISDTNPKETLEKSYLETATTKYNNAKTLQTLDGQNSVTLPDLTLLANKALIKFSSDYPFLPSKGNNTFKSKLAQTERNVTKSPILPDVVINQYIVNNISSVKITTSPGLLSKSSSSTVTRPSELEYTKTNTNSEAEGLTPSISFSTLNAIKQNTNKVSMLEKTPKKISETPNMEMTTSKYNHEETLQSSDVQNNVTFPDLTLLANNNIGMIKLSSEYPLLSSKGNNTLSVNLILPEYDVTTKSLLYDSINSKDTTDMSLVNNTRTPIVTHEFAYTGFDANITESHGKKSISNTKNHSNEDKNTKKLSIQHRNPMNILEKPNLKIVTVKYNNENTLQTPDGRSNVTFPDLTLLANKAMMKFSSDYPLLPSNGNKTLKVKPVLTDHVTKESLLFDIMNNEQYTTDISPVNNTTAPVETITHELVSTRFDTDDSNITGTPDINYNKLSAHKKHKSQEIKAKNILTAYNTTEKHGPKRLKLIKGKTKPKKPVALELNIRVGVEAKENGIHFSVIDEKITSFTTESPEISVSDKIKVDLLNDNITEKIILKSEIKLENKTAQENITTIDKELENIVLENMNLTRRANELKQEDLTRLAAILKKLSWTPPEMQKNTTTTSTTTTTTKTVAIVVDIKPNITIKALVNLTTKQTDPQHTNAITEMPSTASSYNNLTTPKHKTQIPGALTEKLGINNLKSIYNKHIKDKLNYTKNENISATDLMKRIIEKLKSSPTMKNLILLNNSTLNTTGFKNILAQNKILKHLKLGRKAIFRTTDKSKMPKLNKKASKASKSKKIKLKKLIAVLKKLFKGKQISIQQLREIAKKFMKQNLTSSQRIHKKINQYKMDVNITMANTTETGELNSTITQTTTKTINVETLSPSISPTVRESTKSIASLKPTESSSFTEPPSVTKTTIPPLTQAPSTIGINQTSVVVVNNSTQALQMGKSITLEDILKILESNSAPDTRRNSGSHNVSQQTVSQPSKPTQETSQNVTLEEKIISSTTLTTPQTTMKQFWGMILSDMDEVENWKPRNKSTTYEPNTFTIIPPYDETKIRELLSLNNYNNARRYSFKNGLPKVEVDPLVSDIQEHLSGNANDVYLKSKTSILLSDNTNGATETDKINEIKNIKITNNNNITNASSKKITGTEGMLTDFILQRSSSNFFADSKIQSSSSSSMGSESSIFTTNTNYFNNKDGAGFGESLKPIKDIQLTEDTNKLDDTTWKTEYYTGITSLNSLVTPLIDKNVSLFNVTESSFSDISIPKIDNNDISQINRTTEARISSPTLFDSVDDLIADLDDVLTQDAYNTTPPYTEANITSTIDMYANNLTMNNNDEMSTTYYGKTENTVAVPLMTDVPNKTLDTILTTTDLNYSKNTYSTIINEDKKQTVPVSTSISNNSSQLFLQPDDTKGVSFLSTSIYEPNRNITKAMSDVTKPFYDMKNKTTTANTINVFSLVNKNNMTYYNVGSMEVEHFEKLIDSKGLNKIDTRSMNAKTSEQSKTNVTTIQNENIALSTTISLPQKLKDITDMSFESDLVNTTKLVTDKRNAVREHDNLTNAFSIKMNDVELKPRKPYDVSKNTEFSSNVEIFTEDRNVTISSQIKSNTKLPIFKTSIDIDDEVTLSLPITQKSVEFENTKLLDTEATSKKFDIKTQNVGINTLDDKTYNVTKTKDQLTLSQYTSERNSQATSDLTDHIRIASAKNSYVQAIQKPIDDDFTAKFNEVNEKIKMIEMQIDTIDDQENVLSNEHNTNLLKNGTDNIKNNFTVSNSTTYSTVAQIISLVENISSTNVIENTQKEIITERQDNLEDTTSHAILYKTEFDPENLLDKITDTQIYNKTTNDIFTETPVNTPVDYNEELIYTDPDILDLSKELFQITQESNTTPNILVDTNVTKGNAVDTSKEIYFLPPKGSNIQQNVTPAQNETELQVSSKKYLYLPTLQNRFTTDNSYVLDAQNTDQYEKVSHIWNNMTIETTVTILPSITTVVNNSDYRINTTIKDQGTSVVNSDSATPNTENETETEQNINYDVATKISNLELYEEKLTDVLVHAEKLLATDKNNYLGTTELPEIKSNSYKERKITETIEDLTTHQNINILDKILPYTLLITKKKSTNINDTRLLQIVDDINTRISIEDDSTKVDKETFKNKTLEITTTPLLVLVSTPITVKQGLTKAANILPDDDFNVTQYQNNTEEFTKPTEVTNELKHDNNNNTENQEATILTSNLTENKDVATEMKNLFKYTKSYTTLLSTYESTLKETNNMITENSTLSPKPFVDVKTVKLSNIVTENADSNTTISKKESIKTQENLNLKQKIKLINATAKISKIYILDPNARQIILNRSIENMQTKSSISSINSSNASSVYNDTVINKANNVTGLFYSSTNINNDSKSQYKILETQIHKVPANNSRPFYFADKDVSINEPETVMKSIVINNGIVKNNIDLHKPPASIYQNITNKLVDSIPRNTTKLSFLVKINDGEKNISFIHTPKLTHVKVTKLKPVNKTVTYLKENHVQNLLPMFHDKMTKLRMGDRPENDTEEHGYNSKFDSAFANVNSGKFKGDKVVQIFSSRVHRPYGAKTTATTTTAVTKNIRYNTYQPTTKEDLELLQYDGKPYYNRPVPKKNDDKLHSQNATTDNSCGVLKTLRNKFRSTQEFITIFKAANCSLDEQMVSTKTQTKHDLRMSPEINTLVGTPTGSENNLNPIDIDKLSNPILEININSPQIGTNRNSPPMIEINENPLPMQIDRNANPLGIYRNVIFNKNSIPMEISRNSVLMEMNRNAIQMTNNENSVAMLKNVNPVQLEINNNRVNKNAVDLNKHILPIEMNSKFDPMRIDNKDAMMEINVSPFEMGINSNVVPIDANRDLVFMGMNNNNVASMQMNTYPVQMEYNRISNPMEINKNLLKINKVGMEVGKISDQFQNVINRNLAQKGNIQISLPRQINSDQTISNRNRNEMGMTRHIAPKEYRGIYRIPDQIPSIINRKPFQNEKKQLSIRNGVYRNPDQLQNKKNRDEMDINKDIVPIQFNSNFVPNQDNRILNQFPTIMNRGPVQRENNQMTVRNEVYENSNHILSNNNQEMDRNIIMTDYNKKSVPMTVNRSPNQNENNQTPVHNENWNLNPVSSNKVPILTDMQQNQNKMRNSVSMEINRNSIPIKINRYPVQIQAQQDTNRNVDQNKNMRMPTVNNYPMQKQVNRNSPMGNLVPMEINKSPVQQESNRISDPSQINKDTHLTGFNNNPSTNMVNNTKNPTVEEIVNRLLPIQINRNPPKIVEINKKALRNLIPRVKINKLAIVDKNRNLPLSSQADLKRNIPRKGEVKNSPLKMDVHLQTRPINKVNHPMIQSNTKSVPSMTQNNRNTQSKTGHRNTHSGIEINRNVHFNVVTKNFKRMGGQKESLLNPFENSYAAKITPKPQRRAMKRMKIGTRRKEVMTMNTQDFFSQHRFVTPQNSLSKFTKPFSALFKPVQSVPNYAALRPKFDNIDRARRIEHKIRPKPVYMQTQDNIFGDDLMSLPQPDNRNWRKNMNPGHNVQQVGTMTRRISNNVQELPPWHTTTIPKFMKDRVDSMRNFLFTADFLKVTKRPVFNEVVRDPDSFEDDSPSGYFGGYRRSAEEVTDWWLDDMYLKVRLPLPINSNPGMVFPRRHFAKMEEVADLGALFIDDLLDYKEMLDRGELPLERATSREKGQPLCMEQFYRLLGVCRIPEVGKDRLELPPVRTGAEELEELIVVACRNYFYPIPVKAADRGRLTPGEIQAQLLHAMVDAAGAPPAPRIGLLTSMNRDQWARAREHLIKDEMNRMNLELISRALCILCLDEGGGDRPDTDADTNAMLRAMHGAGTRYHSANRWFDKTVQLIISSDGTVGMCYEHSAAEGVAVVRLAERALARAEVADRPAPPPALLPAPQAMKWNVSNEVQRTIETAARELDRAICDLDHKVYTYRGYGREFMKSCRTSPDVYIQLALQYAYYKMYGYLVTTYESASLRRFRNGRVDNIRSAHGAALAWAAAMCTAETPPLNDGDDGQKKVSFNLYGEQKKLELFEEAARKQTSIMEANILGKGIDNHLLGLREAARETLGEVPQVFSDTTYKQMIEFKLSTSQVTTTTDGTFMGYGAVCPDGYGCSYNPKKDCIIFCISSFTSSSVTNTEAFRQSLEEALDSMKLMFQARKAE